MNRRAISAGVMLTLVTAGAFPTLADGKELTEREKIEALIAHVESTRDAEFVRNGTRYTPAEAADFLRRKWRFHAGEVRTARDFIEKIASKSSTSGKPYLVKFKDGRQETSEKFLSAALKTLDERAE